MVIKRVDNDSYLVSPTDDPRKQYLAYRGRLRRIGITSKTVTKEDHEKVQEQFSPSSTSEDQPKEIKEAKYKSRNRKDTDYRKFY